MRRSVSCVCPLLPYVFPTSIFDHATPSILRNRLFQSLGKCPDTMPFKRRSAGFRAVTRWITLFLATSITLGAGIAAASPASSNRATTFQNGEQQVLKSAVGVIRVMIVGDSITQGREGDWTWRYRLWQWFDDQGIDVYEPFHVFTN